MKPTTALFLILTLRLDTGPALAQISLSTLVSFNGTNGADPYAGLVQAQDGNFYGATKDSSPNGYSTAFRITPDGSLMPLCFLTCCNQGVYGRLVLGTDGCLYGTSLFGGAYDAGTAFKITLNGVFTNLYSFTGGTDGRGPLAGLIQAADGNLYGTTETGGQYAFHGTIFRMSPAGALITLVAFNGTNGTRPLARLVEGRDGNFYGTTYLGGDFNQGTIFRMTPGGALTTMLSLNGTNGASPNGSLVQGSDGSFYGTTQYGGIGYDGSLYSGYGTVFKVTWDGNLTTLFSFDSTNGAQPFAGLLKAADGNFYGTTVTGGAYGQGTAFEIDPGGAFAGLFSFKADGTNGVGPNADLAQAPDGTFFGTTRSGGAYDNGTVFRLTVPWAVRPRIEAATQAGSAFTLTWSSLAGRSYQVQFTTNLGQSVWNNSGSAVLATNSTATGSDSRGADQRRFYRVVLLP